MSLSNFYLKDNILFDKRSVNARIILILSNGNKTLICADIARKTGLSFSIISNNIRILEEKGFIKSIKNTRSKSVSLTSKGRELSILVNKILELK